MEYYLSHPDRNVRFILTKFRLSEHKFSIEIGRNLKIPRDQRLLFLYMCDLQCLGRWISFFLWMQEKYQYSKHFIPILSKYIYWNFLELNHEEKLTKILNPTTPEQIRPVTSFIRQSLELRGRLISHNCSSCYCIFSM
jgi:hypothetical protein